MPFTPHNKRRWVKRTQVGKINGTQREEACHWDTSEGVTTYFLFLRLLQALNCTWKPENIEKRQSRSYKWLKITVREHNTRGNFAIEFLVKGRRRVCCTSLASSTTWATKTTRWWATRDFVLNEMRNCGRERGVVVVAAAVIVVMEVVVESAALWWWWWSWAWSLWW